VKRGPLSKRLFCVFAIWILLIPAVTCAQEPERRFFPESGQTVAGVFLQFFDRHGGLDIFGPPISGELVEDGVRVQYFRNLRLELHPENPRPYRVQPGLLGDLLGKPQAPIPSALIPLAGNPTERYYPQTGHTIKQGFLTFFDYYGGLDLFGYPISEMIVEADGRVVQWFQKAQLEWRPNQTGGQIRLAPLGEVFYNQKYSSVAQTPTDAPESAPVQAFGLDIGAPAPPAIMEDATPKSLKATISLQNSITGGFNPGYQQVAVYVTDENDVGVANAVVRLTVSSLEGQHTIVMPPTDRTGLTKISFEIEGVQRGYNVIISALASYGSQTAHTETSFLPWY